MITKLWLITLIATSVSAFADTLVGGSVYFDSQKTLEEVVKLSAARDNESILKLISSGHVTQQTDSNKGIEILTTGLTADSPAEFRFVGGPTTYWTLTKFVAREEAVAPTPTPTPEQSPSPSATPEQSPTPTAKRHQRDRENNDPFDDDNGRRIWHKVDGRWKWYPANRKPEKRALPQDQTPRALPVAPSTPQ